MMAGVSISSQSSSIKNYDVREIAIRFNESVSNQVHMQNRQAFVHQVQYLTDER